MNAFGKTLVVLIFAGALAGCESAMRSVADIAIGEHTATTPIPPNGAYELSRHEQLNEISRKGGIDLVFLGDSITQGWEGAGKQTWDKHYAHRRAANFGIGGDKTQHVQWRLDHGNLDGLSPKLIVVLIGINNGAGNNPPQIAEGVIAILQRLRRKLPEARILLMGIFPYGADANNQNRAHLNGANPILKRAAASDPMIDYRDIGHLFLDEHGAYRPDVTPDRLHLKARGYEIWAAAIEDDVVRLMGER